MSECARGREHGREEWVRRRLALELVDALIELSALGLELRQLHLELRPWSGHGELGRLVRLVHVLELGLQLHEALAHVAHTLVLQKLLRRLDSHEELAEVRELLQLVEVREHRLQARVDGLLVSLRECLSEALPLFRVGGPRSAPRACRLVRVAAAQQRTVQHGEEADDAGGAGVRLLVAHGNGRDAVEVREDVEEGMEEVEG